MTDTASDVLLGAGLGGATATFEEDPARGTGRDRGAAPVLRLSTFEGRLDWLLELARARKVDLAQLSLVEVADQLILALDKAADERDGGDHGPAPLLRRGEWVVMGATLADLRSRLLLPKDSAAGRHAREVARALRDQLIERQCMLEAAEWLDSRAQLGRDVFACGVPTIGAPRQRTTDLTALLRACLAALQAEVARGERYRPRPPAIWRAQDAMARVQVLLHELGDTEPDEASLWRFLPDADALDAAGLAPNSVPDPPLLSRSVVASTLVAGLELARQGQLTLTQEEAFGSIQVHGAAGVAVAGTEAGSEDGS